jgi:DNA-binding XRE family transcriptional regulator
MRPSHFCRPATDYRAEYVETGYSLASLGLTNKEMAGIFGVTEQTLNA